MDDLPWNESLSSVSFDYLPGINYKRRSDPFYYLHDFWTDVSDPDINGKPLMSGGPLGWATFILLVIYWIRVVGPKSMRDRDPYDMKPWLLILNGLTFGGYITGFIVGVWYSNWGLDSFSCQACDLRDRSIEMFIRKSTGYVFFSGKVWELLRPVLTVYRKRDHEITNLYLFHCFCSVFFVYLGLKLYPGGVFSFLPFLDGVYQIFAHAYLIMTCAGDSYLKPSYSFRVFLYRLKLVSGLLLILHGLYFVSQPNCGPVTLKAFQIVYAAIGLYIAPSEWNKMEEARKRTQLMKQELKTKDD